MVATKVRNSFFFSGTKKEHKPKSGYFRWGRGLPHEGAGAKKFGMSLETREIKLFWRDILGFCRDIAAVPEEFEKIRQEKRAKRLSFWVWRPLGGVGVFHAEGWWPKTSCPPSKVCLPWVSKRGIWDVPGFLPGCPGPLAVFKKFVQKNFVRVFRSPRKKS